MRFFKTTNIDFMGPRRKFYFLSGAIILIGLISVATKGLNYGIDFLGGTEILVQFQNDVGIGEVRDAMRKSGFEDAEIKTFGSDREILIRTEQQGTGTEIGSRITKGLNVSFPTNPFTILKADIIGPKIGAELQRGAVYAVLASFLVILIYVAFRFKWIYGVAAVASLVHDVLVTVGLISLLNGVTPWLILEVDQNMIAALLTLIGLSVNDTVVIFDRIRENLNVFRSKSLLEITNKSLNETLSRTIITMGTIVMVLLCLLLLGGEVNRGFAFALAVGVTTGTYSTIYIAGAVVVEWDNRRKKMAPSPARTQR